VNAKTGPLDVIDQYRIALTYSNYPTKRSSLIPTVIAGLVAYEDDYGELEKRNLPRKRDIIHKQNSVFLLQRAFDDIEEYLTCFSILQLPCNSSPEQLENDYIKMLNILRASHLRVISGHIASIEIRPIESVDSRTRKWTRIDFTEGFLGKIHDFTAHLKVLDWRSKDEDKRLLEVAKILARLEYERLRYFGPENLIHTVRASPEQYLQIIRTKWDSPFVEDYSSGQVGVPTIVIKDQRPPFLHHLSLERGARLSLVPLGKFCRGGENRQEILPCSYSSTNNPFGLPLAGSSNEQCHKCRKLFEYAMCLYRKPLCSGYEAACGNKQFAGNVCCGLFGLYVARFGQDLKVGTAVLSRLVGRLLEQGPGSALLVYPLEGIMTAHTLEKVVRDDLRQKIRDFQGFGIKRVFRRAPLREGIVKDFLRDWQRSDERILAQVWNTIERIDLSFGELHLNLGQAQHVILNFSADYEKPPSTFFTLYNRASAESSGVVDGEVVGYRGSFLFLNSGRVVDLKQLQGFVARGTIHERRIS